jgi:hypothetical protein
LSVSDNETTGPGGSIWDVGRDGERRRGVDPQLVKLHERVAQFGDRMDKLDNVPARLAVQEALGLRLERDLKDVNARFDESNRQMTTGEKVAEGRHGESTVVQRIVLWAVAGMFGAVGAAIGHVLFK